MNTEEMFEKLQEERENIEPISDKRIARCKIEMEVEYIFSHVCSADELPENHIQENIISRNLTVLSTEPYFLTDELLNTELEDDDSELGGVSFIGETVKDFIYTLGSYPANLEELNSWLCECGIKPI